jgi:hypothetical protein
VSADYFKVMGIALVAGRAFTNADDESSPAVAIINQWAAVIAAEGKSSRQTSRWTPLLVSVHIAIVGVARDNLGAALILLAKPGPRDASSARCRREPHSSHAPSGGIVEQAKNAVMKVVPANGRAQGGIVFGQVDAQLQTVRTNATQIAGFAVVGLLLAITGLYGVLSYVVNQRTHEIGIRGVLGADRGRILGMVLSQAMRLTLVGVGVGLVGAMLSMRLMTGLLYGTPTNDVQVYAAVSAIAVGVSLLASYFPRGAVDPQSRCDPCSAPRQPEQQPRATASSNSFSTETHGRTLTSTEGARGRLPALNGSEVITRCPRVRTRFIGNSGNAVPCSLTRSLGVFGEARRARRVTDGDSNLRRILTGSPKRIGSLRTECWRRCGLRDVQCCVCVNPCQRYTPAMPDVSRRAEQLWHGQERTTARKGTADILSRERLVAANPNRCLGPPLGRQPIASRAAVQRKSARCGRSARVHAVSGRPCLTVCVRAKLFEPATALSGKPGSLTLRCPVLKTIRSIRHIRVLLLQLEDGGTALSRAADSTAINLRS